MKIKTVIASIIAGLLLCGTNVYAEEDRDINLNYQTYYDEDVPIIQTNGSTYDIILLSWSIEPTEEEVITTTDVNIRISPTTLNQPIATLPKNTKVTLVGISSNGWDIVHYNDKYYFMWYEYLEQIDNSLFETMDAAAKTNSMIEENKKKEVIEETEITFTLPRDYEPLDFQFLGVINWGGYRWTYYSQRVLPGGGLNIPGRHVDEDGFVCDEEGNICLASNDLAYGTIVPTPFGKYGKVYDCGCASGTLDCYCDW